MSSHILSIKSGGKKNGVQGDGNPTDNVHSLLESTLNSLYTDVNNWFSAPGSDSASGIAGSASGSPALSVTNPRPSRLGLGATPAQTRALLSAEERRLRERILGANSTSRKRRREFEHEADLVKLLNKKARTADSDTSVRKVTSKMREDPDNDDESRTQAVTVASAQTESAAATAPAPSSSTRPTDVPLAKSAKVSPADMLSAYLGGKSKKRRKKQNAGGAQAADATHPAIHPALLRSSPDRDA